MNSLIKITTDAQVELINHIKQTYSEDEIDSIHTHYRITRYFDLLVRVMGMSKDGLIVGLAETTIDTNGFDQNDIELWIHTFIFPVEDRTGLLNELARRFKDYHISGSGI